MKNLFDDMEKRDDVDTQALRRALERLKDSPDSSLLSPTQEAPQLLAQNNMPTKEEANQSIQDMYRSMGLADDQPLPVEEPEAPVQPEMEEPAERPSSSLFNRLLGVEKLFGGENTREKQLQRDLKKQLGE